MRKLSVFFAVLLTVAVAAFVGCSGKIDHRVFISVDKSELSFDKLGQSEVITASDGAKDFFDVTWSSDKPTVATVNRGVVTALSNGTAEITCKYEDQEVKTAVTVASEFSVTLDKTIYEIAQAGGKVTIIPTVKLPTIFDTVDKVNYESSNESVVTVATNGEVSAVSNGVALITATTEVIKTVETVNSTTGTKVVTTAPATTTVMVTVGNQFDSTTHKQILGDYAATYDWQGFVKAKSDTYNFNEANRTWIRAKSQLTLNGDGTFTHMITNAMRAGYKGVVGEDGEYDLNDRVYNNVAADAFTDGDKEFAQMPPFAMTNLSNSGIIFVNGGNMSIYCMKAVGSMSGATSTVLESRAFGNINDGLTTVLFRPFDTSVKADTMTLQLNKIVKS